VEDVILETIGIKLPKPLLLDITHNPVSGGAGI